MGANFTVFAPTNAAFQTTLTGAIYQALVSLGVPPATALAQAQALASTPAVFSNPLLYGALTAQTVKGIVVYHVLGTRAFTNNLPTTQTFVPTLLNSAVPAHPGVGLQATFGVPFVTSATVKGVGNATAANIIINASPLTPDPAGTSDQHFLNGTIHKIDQVLLPQ
ncbi:MAG: fasciclin domain-containing protein [Ferruginibacter sp.]